MPFVPLDKTGNEDVGQSNGRIEAMLKELYARVAALEPAVEAPPAPVVEPPAPVVEPPPPPPPPPPAPEPVVVEVVEEVILDQPEPDEGL